MNLGKILKNADIAIAIEIGFKLLLLMSAYTKKKERKKPPTYHEGLTV